MHEIIGRENEIELLNFCYESGFSEFVAIHGRKGMGKSYLINNLFKDRIFFQITGYSGFDNKKQIKKFMSSIDPDLNCKDWFEVLESLENLIKGSTSNGKKIIFLDEISHFDKMKSYFLQALSNFWNVFCVPRSDILLIVSSSSVSWMLNNLIESSGGFYQRISRNIHLKPFTLIETEDYLEHFDFEYSRFDIINLYMILGGVPLYYNCLNKDLSLTQNIDCLLLNSEGTLHNEFALVFHSLFKSNDKYKLVVNAIGSQDRGITREEIVSITKFKSGGGLSRILKELTLNGYIKIYYCFPSNKKSSLYQLVDHLSLFNYHFLNKENDNNSISWDHIPNNSSINSWYGYAFEMVCLKHIEEIKHKLSILGVASSVRSWRNE
jgi:nicotinamide riboside kinase